MAVCAILRMTLVAGTGRRSPGQGPIWTIRRSVSLSCLSVVGRLPNISSLRPEYTSGQTFTLEYSPGWATLDGSQNQNTCHQTNASPGAEFRLGHSEPSRLPLLRADLRRLLPPTPFQPVARSPVYIHTRYALFPTSTLLQSSSASSRRTCDAWVLHSGF